MTRTVVTLEAAAASLEFSGALHFLSQILRPTLQDLRFQGRSAGSEGPSPEAHRSSWLRLRHVHLQHKAVHYQAVVMILDVWRPVDQALLTVRKLPTLHEEHVPHAQGAGLGLVFEDFVVAAALLELPEVDILVRRVEGPRRVVRDDGPRAVVVAVPLRAAALPDDFQLDIQFAAPRAETRHCRSDVKHVVAHRLA